MAGYREFQTGEVLTAANVNSFLMEQATMTFADAAARDAALAGVLREGLLTYNLDEGRLEVYDGTDWVEPAPPPPPQNLVSFHSVTKTDVFSEAIGARPAESGDVTGLTVTMTPASATNLLLVQVAISTNTASPLRLYRDDSRVTSYLGDSVGSRQQASVNAGTASITTSTTGLLHALTAGATTETTFSIRIGTINSSATTVHVNRASDDSNSDARSRTASSMIVMEIAA